MSESIDKMRKYFNQSPEPKSKFLKETRDKINAMIDEIESENDKLREELAKWEQLTAGIELPEYPVTEFRPKDLERENAELRKLCAVMIKTIQAVHDRMRELGVEVD